MKSKRYKKLPEKTNLEKPNSIDNLIPNNWIRLIGAGSGGYFLISSKLNEESIESIFDQNALKGIFKANISGEGVTSLEL